MISQPGPVFVTGGSGFIGRHLLWQLQKRNYKTRALVRRLPIQALGPSVEIVIGDLNKPKTYAAALSGASAVVHAALTDDLSQDRQATLTLQSLSAQAGIRKFVHLSTIAVYGNPASGTITEEAPPIQAPDEYSRTKLAIEEALRTNLQVPEMIILRLGCVYGPGEGWWTDGLLRLMETGKVILVNEGTGTANLIHVADVAALVVLLLGRSNPPFDIFNVTDGMPVPWSRYYSHLEAILGRTATVSMSVAEAREFGKKWLKPSLFRRAIRRLAGTDLIHPLDDCGIDGLASCAIYSNRKAATALGFRATYDLQRGIQTVKFHRDPVIQEAVPNSQGSCEG